MAGRVAQAVRSPAPAGHPGLYDVFIALHVSLALVGFGAVALSGAYGIVGRKGLSRELVRFISGRTWAELALVAAPLFGVAAMTVRPGGSEFAQLWAIAGLTIWVLASALLLGVLRPAEAKLRSAVTEAQRGAASGDADKAIRAHSTRIVWAGAVSDLLFLCALMMMVTQPARL